MFLHHEELRAARFGALALAERHNCIAIVQARVAWHEILTAQAEDFTCLKLKHTCGMSKAPALGQPSEDMRWPSAIATNRLMEILCTGEAHLSMFLMVLSVQLRCRRNPGSPRFRAASSCPRVLCVPRWECHYGAVNCCSNLQGDVAASAHEQNSRQALL